MSECKFMKDCAFYNDRMDKMPASGRLMKNFFCHKSPERCARMRRESFIPVSDTSNKLTPFGFEIVLGEGSSRDTSTVTGKRP